MQTIGFVKEGKVRRLKRVVIREELVALTGNFVQAILLGQLLDLTSRTEDFERFLEEENQTDEEKTKHPKRYGWICKSAQGLKEETMLPLSTQTIRNHLKELVKKGWLEERRNPEDKWDKSLQYRVNLIKILNDLRNQGYPLSVWEDSSLRIPISRRK